MKYYYIPIRNWKVTVGKFIMWWMGLNFLISLFLFQKWYIQLLYAIIFNLGFVLYFFGMNYKKVTKKQYDAYELVKLTNDLGLPISQESLKIINTIK